MPADLPPPGPVTRRLPAPRAVRRAVSVTDRRLVARSALWQPSWVDQAMRGLSGSANRGLLWIGVSAVLVGLGGQYRRAAVRGALALGASSAVANGVLKPLFPRIRPPAHAVPDTRRIGKPPVTSSFPSGHSALAGAYATGVAIESPKAGAVVAPLAAAVAYSRVHTGVHWPSDVLAGAGVGVAVGLATRRWWAAVPREPATLGATAPAPALPLGEGLLILANESAGPAAKVLKGRSPGRELAELLPRAVLAELDPARDFATQVEELLGAHRPRALAVSGGDGTVRVAAAAAVRHQLPLAVLAGGTLNHFATHTGLLAPDAVADALAQGRAEYADTGEVVVDRGQPELFVNTASVGGYPESVRLREKWQRFLGKWPAAVAASARALATATPLHVAVAGRPEKVWIVFVGNGTYTPPDQLPTARSSIHGGHLDVRYLRARPRASRTRLLLAALTGTVGSSPVYARRGGSDHLVLRVHGEPAELALDGDVVAAGTVFEFRSRPGSLVLYRD